MKTEIKCDLQQEELQILQELQKGIFKIEEISDMFEVSLYRVLEIQKVIQENE